MNIEGARAELQKAIHTAKESSLAMRKKPLDLENEVIANEGMIRPTIGQVKERCKKLVEEMKEHLRQGGVAMLSEDSVHSPFSYTISDSNSGFRKLLHIEFNELNPGIFFVHPPHKDLVEWNENVLDALEVRFLRLTTFVLNEYAKDCKYKTEPEGDFMAALIRKQPED